MLRLKIKTSKSGLLSPKILKIKIINFVLDTKFVQRFAEFLIHNNLCFYAVEFLD